MDLHKPIHIGDIILLQESIGNKISEFPDDLLMEKLWDNLEVRYCGRILEMQLRVNELR